MSRTKAFFSNSFAAIINQLVIMIVGFITPHIMISTYGSEINGLTGSISQFLTYFNLVEAGLSSAAVYALYRPIAKKDNNEISSVVSATKNLYIKSGLAFLALTIVFSLIYPLFVKAENLSYIEIMLLVLILATSSTLDFFTLSKYRALLTADQKVNVISYSTAIYNIINTLIIVIFASENFNIVLLRAIALTAVFTRTIILKLYCKKKYPYIDYNAKPNNKALNKRWNALFLQILNAIQTGTPVILATVFTTLKTVSIYSVYNMIVGGIGSVVGIFSTGLSAGFGNVIADDNETVLKKAYSEFEYAYYIIITVIYSVTAVTIISFIRLYTDNISDINYILPITGFIMVTNGILHNLKTPQGMMVISAGLYKETKMQTLTQGLITVIGGTVFSQIWGLNGIVSASILANIYRAIDLLIFIPKNVLHTSPKASAYRMVRVIVLYCIFNLIFRFVNIDVKNYMEWFIYALCVGVFILTSTLAINVIFEKNCFMALLKRIRELLKK